MRVLIVDPDEARAALVAEGLAEGIAGEQVEARRMAELDLAAYAAFKPDAVIIACESPDRDTLEALRQSGAAADRPVVMFVDRSEPGAATAALEAGVAAYIVDGFSAKRVASVLEVASMRFGVIQRMRADLEKARSDLAARKDIERAKGVLMKMRGIGEEAAYAELRKLAMDSGRPLAAVAKDLLVVVGLLDGGKG